MHILRFKKRLKCKQHQEKSVCLFLSLISDKTLIPLYPPHCICNPRDFSSALGGRAAVEMPAASD